MRKVQTKLKLFKKWPILPDFRQKVQGWRQKGKDIFKAQMVNRSQAANVIDEKYQIRFPPNWIEDDRNLKKIRQKRFVLLSRKQRPERRAALNASNQPERNFF